MPIKSEVAYLNYLTISRRRLGDYKPIFTEPKANCFSINFQVFTKRKSTQVYKNSFEKNYL